MKNFLQHNVFTILVFFFSQAIFAQQCDKLMIFRKGANYEMETYNNKDKKQSRIAYVVNEIEKNTEGTVAKIHTTVYDEKDKLTGENDLKMICSGDKIILDMKEMFKSIQSQQSGGANNFEVDIEGAMIDIPRSIKIGQTLEPVVTTMKMMDKSPKTEMMRMTMTTQNRKIESREQITTPAGTFDCIKISYETLIETKMMMMDMKLPSHTFKGILYYSEDSGMIKTVELDKKDQMKSYTMLTKMNK